MPSDLTKFPGGTLVPQLIGGPRSEKLAEYESASPVGYVSAGDPPVFLYHGGVDRLVPLDHATDYKALLDERSEEHTSELQSLMRISYAVFCLKKKQTQPEN